jgi:hypothetical protein
MTVVYPLANQSDYTELKYSLRSVDKFLSPSEVIIVSERAPEWINNVTWIQLPDIHGRRQISVRKKILSAFEFATEILFMNDDFYFLRPVPAGYYFDRDIKFYAYTGSKKLQEELRTLKKPSKNFDLHYPIVLKNDFKQVMENFSSDTLIRSAYCNYLEIQGEQIPDCKFLKAEKPEVIRAVVKERSFISTGPGSLKSVLPVLEELFPTKSRFEI